MIQSFLRLLAVLALVVGVLADPVPPAEPLFSVAIPSSREFGAIGKPALAQDGTIYLAGLGGLHALDPYGAIRWSAYTNNPDLYPNTGVSIAPDQSLRVALNDNSIVALNPDGSLRWSHAAEEPSYQTMAVGADGAVLGGVFRIIALNADGSLRWKYFPGVFERGPAAIALDGTVYFGCADSHLYALKPDGSLRWKYRTGGGIQTAPAIAADGTVYVSAGDRYLYALNPDGTLRWRTPQGGDGSAPVVGTDGTLYYGTSAGILRAHRPNGSALWNFNSQGRPMSLAPALAANGDVVVCGDTFVFGVSSTGEERWRFDAKSYPIGSPAIGLDGAVHLAISQFKTAIALGGTAPPAQSPWPDFMGSSRRDGRSPSVQSAAPQIVGPPRNTTATNGSRLVLRVQASGVPTPNWQWRKEGNPIVGATQPIFHKSASSLADAGSYDVVISNASGAITSAPVVVSVIDPPSITRPPVAGWVRPGGTTTLDVLAAGASPLSYQWSFNGNALPGATAAALTLTNFQSTNVGLYSVIVSNLHGSVTSAPVQLTLLVPGIARWSFSLPQGMGHTPAIGVDGVLYFGGAAGDPNFYAVDRNGVLRWKVPLSSHAGASPMIGPDGTLYFGQVDGKITALRPDGTLAWEYQGEGILISTPSLGRDGTIYVGSATGPLYAFNPGGGLRWKLDSGMNARSSPAVGADGTFYMGGSLGSIRALNPDGSTRWSYQVGPSVSLSPAIGADGTVYVGADDRKLYALNSDGTLRWTYALGAVPSGSPVLAVDGTIYCGASDGVLHAITPEGLRRWTYSVAEEGPGDAVVSSTGMVYFCDRRTLHALKPDGKLEWKTAGGESITTAPQIHPDGAVVFGQGVDLVAVEAPGTLGSSAWPTVHHDLRFTGQGILQPQIHLDAPISGAQFVTGETIGIRLRARSSNGAVTQIVLTLNQTNLAVLPAGQLAMDWVVTVPGNYTLTATAIDSALARRTTPPVLFTALAAGTKPSITRQPSPQKVSNGATVRLEAEATGSLPLEFQWFKDGLVVPGADGPTLTLTGVSLADSARYALAVRNSAGAVTSAVVAVSVLQPVPSHRSVFGPSMAYPPAIGADGNTYVVHDGLVAYSPDGTRLWRYGYAGPLGPSIGADQGLLLPSSQDRFVSLRREGAVGWYSFTDAPVTSASAVGADGRIHFGTMIPNSQTGAIHAISATGIPLWKTPVIGANYGTPALAANGDLYAAVGTNLICFAHDGQVKWRFPTAGDAGSPAIGEGGTIYFGSGDGRLRALSAAGAALWAVDVSSAVSASPCIGTDGTVYVGTLGTLNPATPEASPRLLAISPSGGIRWDFPVLHPIQAAPAVAADGTIYLGSSVFYAINANGTEKWEFEGDGPCRAGVTIGPDGTVYLGSGRLFAFSGGSKPAPSPWPMVGRDYRHRSRASAGRPPVVAVTIPAAQGEIPMTDTIGLAASVVEGDEPVEKVEWWVDGIPVATATRFPYVADWASPTQGTHSVTVRATDRLGVTTDSSAVPFSVTAPVLVTLSSPPDGSTAVVEDSIPLRVRMAAGAPTITEVAYYDGASQIATLNAAPFDWDWTTAGEGTHEITARARSVQGQQLISPGVRITVVPRPPIRLTSPNSRSVFAQGSAVPLAADVSTQPNPIQRVEFLANGQVVGSDTTSPFRVTWTNTATGAIALTARSIDSTGQTNTSAPVTIWSFPYGTQTADFGRFDSAAGLLTQGDAVVVSNRVSLTTSGNSESKGGAWMDLPVYLGQGFELVFQQRIANRVAGGGAGFAVVIQGNPTPVLGSGGAGLGYEGIPRSLAIEFDSYADRSKNDPPGTRVGLHSRGIQPNSADEAHAFVSVEPNFSFTDGVTRRVRVVYEPGSEDGKLSGVLRVTREPNTSPDLSLAIDLPTFLGLVDGRAWIGFTAANGPGSETHEILQWRFTATAAEPVITEQPQAVTTVVSGASTSLSVKATGLRPLQYQWRFRGTNLPGQNGSTLTLAQVQPGQAGPYAVEVSNATGSTVSQTAQVVVTGDGVTKWDYQGPYAARSPLAMDADGNLYYQAEGNSVPRLISLTSTGQHRWDIPSNGSLTAAPVISPDGVIYLVSPEGLTARNSQGVELWSYPVASGVFSAPALGADGMIHVVATPGHLLAVRPDGILAWDRDVKAEVAGTPAIGSDGTIYFGDAQGRFHALNADGSQRWIYTATAGIAVPPAIAANGVIHFGSVDGRHHVLNPDGSLRWSIPNGSPRIGPVIARDGTVYLVGGRSLRAFDAQGVQRWIHQTGDTVLSAPTLAATGLILLGSTDGRLRALGPDGTERWSVAAGNGIYGPGTLIGPDGTIYAATGDGHVMAFSGTSPLASVGWPTLHRNLRRTGAVPPSGAPRISQQPLSQTIGAGTNLVLRASAIGLQPIGYTWLRNGLALSDTGNLSGTLSPTLVISGTRLDQSGTYSVVVSNSIGTATSVGAVVTVVPFHQPPGTVVWSRSLESPVLTSPARGLNGELYFSNEADELVALDANGALLWKFHAGARCSEAAVGPDGVIYFSADQPVHRFFALNPNGTRKWETALEVNTLSSPAIGHDGRIHVTSGDGLLNALNPDGTVFWTIALGARFRLSPPAIGRDGMIFIGAGFPDPVDGHPVAECVALYPDATLAWKFTTRGLIGAPAIGHDDRVYFGGEQTYAFDRLGRRLWTLNEADHHPWGPVVDPGGSVVTSTGQAIASDGTRKWRGLSRTSAALGSDGGTYLMDEAGNLRGYRPDGSIQWVTNINAFGVAVAPMLTPEGRLYMAKGNVIAAVQASSGLAGQGWPMGRLNPARTANLQTGPRPLVVITTPLSGQHWPVGVDLPLAVRFPSTGHGIQRVSYRLNGQELAVSTEAPFSAVWRKPTAGSHVLSAVVLDTNSLTSVSTDVTVVISDLPQVELQQPLAGRIYLPGDDVLLSAVASDPDGTVAKVDFYQGTTLIGSVSTPPYAVLWKQPAPGTYRLTARVFDNAGDTSVSAEREIVVDALPVVSLVQPADNTTLGPDAPVELVAEVSDADDPIARVDFFDGSTLLGAKTQPPYVWSVPDPLSGIHSFFARAQDSRGGSTRSATVTVRVAPASELPTVSFGSPFDRARVVAGRPVPVSVTAADRDGAVASIELSLDGSVVAGRLGASSLEWSWLNPLAGTHLLTARATGAQGTVGTRTIEITAVEPGNEPVAALTPSTSHRPALWTTDGPVHALLRTNGILYVGGSFTHVGQYVAGDSIINVSDAVPDLSHPAVDTLVNVLIGDGQGGYYIGGLFNTIGGVPRRNLAHVKADKSVDLAFRADSDGHVLSLALADGVLYVGGEFRTVGGIERRYLAALNPTTGELLPWNPAPTDWVAGIAVSNGVVYVGGNFEYVGGEYRDRIAALDATNGEALAWNPGANRSVGQLLLAGGRLFAVGPFSQMAGQSRPGFAALNPITGALDAFNPDGPGSPQCLAEHLGVLHVGGSGSLRGFDLATGSTVLNVPVAGTVYGIAATGNTIYLDGDFDRVNGVARSRVAAMNRITGAVLGLDLNPTGRFTVLGKSGTNVFAVGQMGLIQVERRGLAAIEESTGFATAWNPGTDGTVHALATRGDLLYVGGQFTRLAGESNPGLGAVSRATGQATGWKPQVANVRTLLLAEDSLFAGGYFNQVGNRARNHVVELDLRTGMPTAWNPDADGAVRAMIRVGDTLYLGGEFTSLGGATRRRLAAVNRYSGRLLPWSPDVNGVVMALAEHHGFIQAGGGFNRANGKDRAYLASFDADSGTAAEWFPETDGGVLALDWRGDVLYLGGQFTRLGGSDRLNLGSIDAGRFPPAVESWNPRPGTEPSDSVLQTLLLTEGTLYVGGRFRAPAANLIAYDFPARTEVLPFLPTDLFRMNFHGPLGHYYVFEASTNLTHWTPILTNKPPLLFEDLDAFRHPARFYRVRPLE